MFKMISRIFLMIACVSLIALNSNASSNTKVIEEVSVENNILTLLLEIKRVGTTKKWNSSQFFGGRLNIHVMKDGTVTNTGHYNLPGDKLGFPLAVRVINIDDKGSDLVFAVGPGAKYFFRSSVSIPFNILTDNDFTYNGSKLLEKDHRVYLKTKVDKVYIHSFSTETQGQKISYDFYSYDEEIKDNVSFLRLVVDFSKL